MQQYPIYKIGTAKVHQQVRLLWATDPNKTKATHRYRELI